MKKIFILMIGLLGIYHSLTAQSIPANTCAVVYTYDAAGNRLKQEYVCNNSSEPQDISLAKENALNKLKADVVKVDALYPNPTTGRFTVTFAAPLTNAKVFIVDAGGRPVVQLLGSGSRMEFDLSKSAAGIYFLRIEKTDGGFISQKVIKQ